MIAAKPFLFKRPNGFWHIHYKVDGRHKWKSTGTKDKNDAIIKLRQFQPSRGGCPNQKCLTEFGKEFLEYAVPTYAHATCNIFRLVLRNLQNITGACPLADIRQ